MTERELARRARHRLVVRRHAEEVSGNIAATCRYYGISRNCYYKWLKRYEEEGLEGLKDRSGAPPKLTEDDPRRRSSRRSCGCASATTSGQARVRCTCSGTTRSR